MARVVAAVALGSSLGERHAHLAFARQGLTELLPGCRFSSIVETAPVDVPGEQTPFLNAAAVGDCEVSARELLTALQALENARGRIRPYRNAPRTLDLDLILFGDHIIDEPGLCVPHPRFRDRLFVLEPLAEIGAALVDPVSGLSIEQLLHNARR